MGSLHACAALSVQCEQSHLLREHEVVQERTTLRYEECITELHSVIAELNKKIDRLQATTIRYWPSLPEAGSDLGVEGAPMNSRDACFVMKSSLAPAAPHASARCPDCGQAATLGGARAEVVRLPILTRVKAWAE